MRRGWQNFQNCYKYRGIQMKCVCVSKEGRAGWAGWLAGVSSLANFYQKVIPRPNR